MEVAETERINVLRQDSIANAEEARKFRKAIPNYKRFFGENGLLYMDSYLKSLGYKGSEKEVNSDAIHILGNFTFTLGDRSIHIRYDTFMGVMNSYVTINGDEEALNAFYKDAKKLQGKEDWWQCSVKKKGNTVSIEGGMD